MLRSRIKSILRIALFLVSTTSVASAEVRLPKIFTDHMVLQQGVPVAVWGWADSDEKITISLAGQMTTTVAGADGKWRVNLPALKAEGAKSHTLTIQGKNTIELQDVLIGEVWLASGQSNMNRPVDGSAIAEANYPEIRLFTTNGSIPREDSLNETVGWLPCTPETITQVGPEINGRRRAFSEVAFHFAEKLHAELEVPIGIIHTSMGGSTAKDWTPNPAIAEQFPFDQDHGRINHKHGVVYQARVAGLVPFTVKGFVWYQGEDDGRNKNYYRDLKNLIESWRTLWQDESLPFYMVQIGATTYASGMLGVWEAQQQIVKTVPHTGIAASNDMYEGTKNGGFIKRIDKKTGLPIAGGSNPHPTGRPLVARRLADIALLKTYHHGDTNREVFGPTYADHEIHGNKIIVRFKHVGGGLKSDDGEPLPWFEVSDGTQTDERQQAPLVYVTAQARLAGKDQVEVWADGIAEPKYVRFSWHPLARHNLINQAGLPALPFRSDDLPQMWNRR